MPVPDGLAGVAALHGAIQIVPVIENTALDARSGGDVEMFERLACLQQSQKMKCTVEDAYVLVGGDRNDGVACESRAANDIARGANAIQTEMHPGDQGR